MLTFSFLGDPTSLLPITVYTMQNLLENNNNFIEKLILYFTFMKKYNFLNYMNINAL